MQRWEEKNEGEIIEVTKEKKDRVLKPTEHCARGEQVIQQEGPEQRVRTGLGRSRCLHTEAGTAALSMLRGAQPGNVS